MSFDIKQAMDIALNEDVSTPPDGAVLYSVSYLKTTKNRDDAYAFVQKNKACKTLDHTPCGKALCEMDTQRTNDVLPEAVKEVWKKASQRFIASASGNVTAFVDGADKRSTFCSVEVPAILKNNKIKTINGIDKFEFLNK